MRRVEEREKKMINDYPNMTPDEREVKWANQHVEGASQQREEKILNKWKQPGTNPHRADIEFMERRQEQKKSKHI
jgi:hypothetical protein